MERLLVVISVWLGTRNFPITAPRNRTGRNRPRFSRPDTDTDKMMLGSSTEAKIVKSDLRLRTVSLREDL